MKDLSDATRVVNRLNSCDSVGQSPNSVHIGCRTRLGSSRRFDIHHVGSPPARVSSHVTHVLAVTHGGFVWTADHTCGRREAADESGEQPEGQPNRLTTMTGSKRPGSLPKRQRGRRGEEERERDRQGNAMETLCT